VEETAPSNHFLVSNQVMESEAESGKNFKEKQICQSNIHEEI